MTRVNIINNKRGFILLDITLSLFVLILTMSLVISTFSFGIKAWQRVQAEMIIAENEKVMLDWLVHEIALNAKRLTIIDEGTIVIEGTYPQKRTMLYMAVSTEYKEKTMFISRQIVGMQSGVNQISDPNQVAVEKILFEKVSDNALKVKIVVRDLKYSHMRTMEQIIVLYNGSVI